MGQAFVSPCLPSLPPGSSANFPLCKQDIILHYITGAHTVATSLKMGYRSLSQNTIVSVQVEVTRG